MTVAAAMPMSCPVRTPLVSQNSPRDNLPAEPRSASQGRPCRFAPVVLLLSCRASPQRARMSGPDGAMLRQILCRPVRPQESGRAQPLLRSQMSEIRISENGYWRGTSMWP